MQVVNPGVSSQGLLGAVGLYLVFSDVSCAILCYVVFLYVLCVMLYKATDHFPPGGLRGWGGRLRARPRRSRRGTWSCRWPPPPTRRSRTCRPRCRPAAHPARPPPSALPFHDLFLVSGRLGQAMRRLVVATVMMTRFLLRMILQSPWGRGGCGCGCAPCSSPRPAPPGPWASPPSSNSQTSPHSMPGYPAMCHT